MSPVPALSSTNPVSYQSAKATALQLISAFNSNSLIRSNHYPKLSKSTIIQELKRTNNILKTILHQKRASLCGPAAFFFTLVKVRPDIYVQLVIDLFTHGRAQLKDLKLRSSPRARQYQPWEIRESDWLLLSSINPEYDHPSEQWDGITLPDKLKKWFVTAGFGTVVDHTNLVVNKGLDTLLQAQNDYHSGHSICLFVDADIFRSFGEKDGRSLIPNHWVVMISDVKLRKYNEKTQSLVRPMIIDQSVVKTIKEQIQLKQADAMLNNEYGASTETEDKILVDAFSWGKAHRPVASGISATQDARLSYFLDGFYGYIKVKR